jgi:hypothetical protein
MKSRDRKQKCQHDQEEIVVRQLAAEREIPPAARDRGTLQADRGANEIPGAGENPDQLGDRDGGHAEIMSGQPESRHADHNRKPDRERDRDRDGGHRRPTPLRVEQQRRVGAEPEEHAVADGNLPGIAADDVPRRCRDRGQQERHADIAIERPGQHQRIDEQRCREHNNDQARGQNFGHAFPINPCGRNQSSATNSP